LLRAIHSSVYWWILKKTILFFLKINTKKSAKKANSSQIQEWHFVKRKNEGRKPDKKLGLIRLKFIPRKPRLKMPLRNPTSCPGCCGGVPDS
jgi:hypothetical protein